LFTNGSSLAWTGGALSVGLGLAGADGVAQTEAILRREFERAMMQTGRAAIASIDRSVLW